MCVTSFELRKIYNEYTQNKNKIREIIKDGGILTDKGKENYNHLNERNKALKKILNEHNIGV